MLIILDGLDEVGEARSDMNLAIQEFCEEDVQRNQPNRVIVTCREHSYQARDLRAVIPNEVRVEAFSSEHMRTFLSGWPRYNDRSPLRLYGLLQNDAQIRNICRNPLLLTILTGLYLDQKEFLLPSTRDLFYFEALKELMIHRPARRNIQQESSRPSSQAVQSTRDAHRDVQEEQVLKRGPHEFRTNQEMLRKGHTG
jgi:hypothetical protein